MFLFVCLFVCLFGLFYLSLICFVCVSLFVLGNFLFLNNILLELKGKATENINKQTKKQTNERTKQKGKQNKTKLKKKLNKKTQNTKQNKTKQKKKKHTKHKTTYRSTTYHVHVLRPGVIYCRVLVKKYPGCLFNSVEMHCTCHQLLSSSCSLFRDILLVCIEGDS